MKSELLRDLVVDALDDLKGVRIHVLDVRGVSSVTDFLVIATGNSSRHVKSLAENVVLKGKSALGMPINLEGADDGEWILVDLGDVVAHVMLAEAREYYALEKLWTRFEKAYEGEMVKIEAETLLNYPQSI